MCSIKTKASCYSYLNISIPQHSDGVHKWVELMAMWELLVWAGAWKIYSNNNVAKYLMFSSDFFLLGIFCRNNLMPVVEENAQNTFDPLIALFNCTCCLLCCLRTQFTTEIEQIWYGASMSTQWMLTIKMLQFPNKMSSKLWWMRRQPHTVLYWDGIALLQCNTDTRITVFKMKLHLNTPQLWIYAKV